jgi:hypothetical protein
LAKLQSKDSQPSPHHAEEKGGNGNEHTSFLKPEKTLTGT